MLLSDISGVEEGRLKLGDVVSPARRECSIRGFAEDFCSGGNVHHGCRGHSPANHVDSNPAL